MDKPQVVGEPRALELPLPLFESQNVGELYMPDGGVLRIVVGLGKDEAEQLRKHALDESDTELQAQTSDRKRFGEGSYETWYAKGRTPVALIDTEGYLAAILWFGSEELPDDTGYTSEKSEWDTIGVRSYHPYRGKGIMTPFCRFALALHEQSFPGSKVWLDTDAANAAGIALYEKLGFISRGYRKNGRLLMTKE